MVTGLSRKSAYGIRQRGEPRALFAEASRGESPYDPVPSNRVVVCYILR